MIGTAIKLHSIRFVLLWVAGMCFFTLTVIAQSNPPAETSFKELLEKDGVAQRQIDYLIRSNDAFTRQGAGLSAGLLNTKLRQLMDPMVEAYEEFLVKYPKFVKGHLAYASFMLELDQQKPAEKHLQRAIQLEPSNPVALNNLANYFGQYGPAAEAFANYERAIELRPNEATYYRNYASAMLVNRAAARDYLKVKTEQQVFRRALDLFKKAVTLSPEDFLLASTLAQSYYRVQPVPYSEAKQAWKNALRLASAPAEQQGVRLHLARLHIATKDYEDARRYLNGVTDESLDSIRKPLLAKLPLKMTPLPFSTSTRGPRLFNLSTAPPPGSK